MANDEQIRIALERVRKAIELRPATALGTMISRTRLESGLRCVSSNGDWTVELDEPEAVGGDGSAPSPGVYMLAALTSCTAMSIKNCAILSGIKIDAISIDVEGDYDDLGMFGFKPLPPAGWTGFRLKIDVDCDAPEDEVRRIVQRALETSSTYALFADPQKLVAEVSIAGQRENTED